MAKLGLFYAIILSFLFGIFRLIKFLSLLDLSGRSLTNSVINLGIQDQYADALTQLGFDFEVLAEQVGEISIRYL